MKKLVILLSMSTVFLSACGNKHDKMVGYWQLENVQGKRIMQIFKEGKDSYILKENVVARSNVVNGKEGSSLVLEKKDDTLAVNNGLAAMPLHLSDDGQTLRISKNQYKKVDENFVNKTIENIKVCHEIETEYRTKVKELPIFTRDPAIQEQRKTLAESTTIKMQAIEDCKFGIY